MQMDRWLLSSWIDSYRQYLPVIFWLFVLLGIVWLGLLLVSRVKRIMSQPAQREAAGFSLSDLRKLRDGGQISDEEFERAKEKVVAATRRALERDRENKMKSETSLQPSTDPVEAPPAEPKGPFGG